MAHIIVVGNEKGGAGKSTVTMHVATSLARMDYRVGAIDLDLRQQTFGRYCANRQNHLTELGIELKGPSFFPLPEIDKETVPEGENIFDHRLSARGGTRIALRLLCRGHGLPSIHTYQLSSVRRRF